MAKHTIQGEDRIYVLNFNSYAVMHLFRKYGADGLNDAPLQDVNFDMIRWGLSDNGRADVEDVDVYDFIDDIGGVMSDNFLITIRDWVFASITVPEVKKKEEEIAAV